jgi:RNA recognition motif-containing protein
MGNVNLRIFREQDKEATVYIGNIDERVTDSLIWELMLQAGRIVNVHLPKDRVTQTHQGYGFVEFISEEDAEYAARIMNQVRLYGKPIRVNKVCFFPLSLKATYEKYVLMVVFE